MCGRRHGLIANATRWVRWGDSPGRAAERDAQRRIHDVEAEFFTGTRIGATIAEAFGAGIDGYAVHGFGRDEWRRHHQGGAAGYAGRDPRGTRSVADLVQPEIPDVQRRTIERVAAWMTAIKPLTIGRRVLESGEVEVTDAAWWRVWATVDGIVAVVDGPAASVRARDGRAVATFVLPD